MPNMPGSTFDGQGTTGMGSLRGTQITQVCYIPEDNRTGYVQSWHFTVQRELAQNLLLDIGYVGNHDVGLTILSDANQAFPNALNQNLTLAQRRPIPNFSTIEVAFDGGFGSYNALQIKVEKRYSKGLYLLNSFAWSKALDDGPGHLENYDGDNSRINYYDRDLEKGLSSYNQPLNDTLALIRRRSACRVIPTLLEMRPGM